MVDHGRLPDRDPLCAFATEETGFIHYSWLGQTGLYLLYHLGEVLAFEIDEMDLSGLEDLEGETGGLISQADIEHAAAGLEPNSSAGLLIWEDLWAAAFADAIRNSGGVVVEGARIPDELIVPHIENLPTAG